MMLMLMVMLICTLEGFVEVETEVGKDHPELLPPVRVLELSEEKSQWDIADVIVFMLLFVLVLLLG